MLYLIANCEIHAKKMWKLSFVASSQPLHVWRSWSPCQTAVNSTQLIRPIADLAPVADQHRAAGGGAAETICEKKKLVPDNKKMANWQRD